MVAGQDLGDASVRHLQLATDLAGPSAAQRHIHNLETHLLGQRAPIDVVAA